MDARPPDIGSASVSVLTPRAWLLLAACSLLWGLPYLLIKVVVEDNVPATVVVFARAAIGAAVLLPFVWRARGGGLRILRGRWGAVAVLASLDMAVPFLLITAGEEAIASSLAGILVASVPLLIALLAIRFDHSERVRGLRLAGLLVGFAGVGLLLGAEVSGDSAALLGAAAVLLASLSSAAATLYLKRAFGDVPPVTIVASTLIATAAMLAVPAAVQAPSTPSMSGDTVAALVALGVLCSGAAYVAFYALVQLVGAGRASVNTYISPAIAVAAGVIVLGEAVTGAVVAGMLLVLAGSWLSTGGMPPGLGRRVRSAEVAHPLAPGVGENS